MGTYRYVGTPALTARAQAAIHLAVHEAASDLAQKAKEEAPTQSGDLAAGITVDGPYGRRGRIWARVRTADKTWYAALVHEGAGPHTIRAKEGALQIGSEFAASAQHPGFQGTKFLERPLLAARSGYVAKIAAAGRRVF